MTHAPRLSPPPLAHDPGLRWRRVQWRVLLATSFCYLFYYTGRQNFGWAIKGLREDLHLSNTEIGWISGTALLCYGLGQLVSGHLGDRLGGRRMTALGALLSCGLNWVASFAGGFWTLVVPWALNNAAQSMGYAPASRLISNWWGPRERGRAYGIFNFAAGFSSVVTFATAILVLGWLPWVWVFRLPVLLMPLGALVFFLLVRDRPEELGFRGPSAGAAGGPADAPAEPHPSIGQSYRRILANRRFLVASLGFGFNNWGRLALLVWAPGHFLGARWKEDPGAAWIALALPLGMALGALAAGYAADRLFGADRPRLIALALVLAGGATLAMFFAPREQPALGLLLLFLAGFFIFGSISTFSVLAVEVVGREAVGAGTGFMNAVGYGTAALGDLVIGVTLDATGRTESVFLVSAVACLLGALCALASRR